MRTNRTLLTGALLLVTTFLAISSASAQTTYKRHALIEEGTGTWCGYCPYGAYALDSIEAHMGDHAVIISYHGPAGYGEPMYAKQCDTLSTTAGNPGFPFSIIGRNTLEVGGPGFYPNDGWSGAAKQMASQAPTVDFRLINAVYDAGSKAVDFDVEITPFNLSKMMREDTVKYVTLAALTEDGIVESQHRYAYQGLPEAQIDDFHHYNVLRKMGGKTAGDVFTLGTKTTVTYPIRRHYHLTVSDANWNADSIRVKTFAAVIPSHSTATYLDADQTGYITLLPGQPAPAVWVVLPRAKDVISADSASMPIIWSHAGASASVTLNYSLDSGKSWIKIADAINKTQYSWTIPNAAYGHSVEIQVTDGTNTQTTGLFSIAAKPQGIISLIAPVGGETLVAGSHFNIQFGANSLVTPNRSIEYSTNGGTDWQIIAQVSGATSYDWTVPSTPTTQAIIKIVDDNNIEGRSGIFTIESAGTVSSVTLGGLDATNNIGRKKPLSITWATQGAVGETIDLDVSYDNKMSWLPIINHYTFGAATEYTWTTPDADYSNAVIRATFANGASGYSNPFSIGSAASGVDDPARSSFSIVPNPFASSTTVNYTLTESGDVSFVLTDILGREALRISLGTQNAGLHQLTLDGSKLPQGQYEYRLVAGKTTQNGKVEIVR